MRWFSFVSLLAAFWLGSCSVPSTTVSRSRVSGASSSFASAPPDRPGLGTKWGETRRSVSGSTTFVRAASARPLATAEIFYNDRDGIEATAAASEFRRVWPVLSGPAASLISIGLKIKVDVFSRG